MRFPLGVTAASIALALANPAQAQQASPPDACTETPANAEQFALARGIIEIALPAEQSEVMLSQMMGGMNQAMRQMVAADSDTSDPGLIAIRDKYLNSIPQRATKLLNKHLPQMKLAQACAYTHMFDLNELRQINAFARTPAGAHFFQSGMNVMSDPAVQAWMQEYLKEAKVAMGAMIEDMKTEIDEYLAAKKKSGKKD